MRFGICCYPGQFETRVGEKPGTEGMASLLESCAGAGADYIELGVGLVRADGEEREYQALAEAMSGAPIGVETFNTFIPAHLPITGPEARLSPLVDYATVALARCATLGGQVVVFGSGKARSVPAGFDQSSARRQFIEFCRELGPIAESAEIVIAIEPLNRREDNLINTMTDGISMVDEIGHPQIQLLADLYHIAENDEPLNGVGDSGKRLRHTHVADIGRVAPGFAPSGEADFAGFFKELRRAGYGSGQDRCSFEGSFGDIHAEMRPLLSLLRERWEQSAGD